MEFVARDFARRLKEKGEEPGLVVRGLLFPWPDLNFNDY
jgi:hypothetical protein